MPMGLFLRIGDRFRIWLIIFADRSSGPRVDAVKWVILAFATDISDSRRPSSCGSGGDGTRESRIFCYKCIYTRSQFVLRIQSIELRLGNSVTFAKCIYPWFWYGLHLLPSGRSMFRHHVTTWLSREIARRNLCDRSECGKRSVARRGDTMS